MKRSDTPTAANRFLPCRWMALFGPITATLIFCVAMLGKATAAPGDLDAFNPTLAGGIVYATVVQPDGKVILGGDFTSVLGTPRNFIARLNADGTLDMGFDPNANSAVYSVAVQADGRVLLGGEFSTLRPNGAVSATARNRIARVNADGTLDNGFNPNAGGFVYGVAVQADGKVLLAGEFLALQPNGAVSTTTRNRIARLNADGSLDNGFNPNANDAVFSVAVQADGKVLLCGRFTTLQPNGAASATTRNRVARVNANGSLDNSFNPNANNWVNSVSVQADDKVLLSGSFTTLQPNGAASATTRNRIARTNSDGTLDTGFNPNANNGVFSVAVQADGKVILGGSFTTLQPNGAASATTRNRIARVNADGSLDVAFNPNANSGINSVAVQADGKVLLSGGFTALQPNGAATATPRSFIARLVNDPAAQNLSVSNPAQLDWTRGGSAPELSHTTFELSTNGGTIWSTLGVAQRVGITPNWRLTGLSLPVSGQIRARGTTTRGQDNGSSGLIEQVASYNLGSPEIAVSGNGVNIADGDTIPGLTDHTDFGSINIVGATVTRTFTITNSGSGELGLTGTPRVALSGIHAADFSVTVQPSTPVAATLGSTTFQVTFNPSAVGLRTATLSIDNNDSNENPFNFNIQGTGGEPDIVVSGNGFDISNGDTSPDSLDHTEFVNTMIGWQSPRIFGVTNIGTGTLNLTGTPLVVVTGIGSTAFSVSSQPNLDSYAPGVGRSFTITFAPDTPGSHAADVSISNDDSDENPYTFRISGIGILPPNEIDVSGNGSLIADGDTTPDEVDDTDFGIIRFGGTQTLKRTFTIANSGGSPLVLSGNPIVSLSGSPSFTVSQQPLDGTVAPTGSQVFTVTFNPSTPGTHTASVSINNDDSDEDPFNFDLRATALSVTTDTDSDGLNDWAEHQFSAFGFDWQVSQPALVAALNNGANDAGFYTLPQVQALHVGTPLLQRNQTTGQFKLTIGLKKSTDLTNFSPYPFIAPQTTVNGDGKIEFLFNSPDNAAFFKVGAE